MVYEFQAAAQSFPAGVSSRTWKLGPQLVRCRVNPGFEAVVKRFGSVPPGQYHLYLSMDTATGSLAGTHSSSVRYSVDSVLSPGGRLRSRLNKAFGAGTPDGGGGGALQQRLFRKKRETAADSAGAAAAQSQQQVGRSLRGLKGVDTRTVRRDGVVESELYCEGWFLGRYALADPRSMRARAQQEYRSLKDNAASGVQNELEGFRSVGSQVRDLYAAGAGKELRGDLDVNVFSATGRDPYSVQDPTYADLHGTVATELRGIPVALEGYYTTQDAHREARASYLRVRYDAQAAKDKLLKLIAGYQSKFSETQAKGAGLDQVYSKYRDNLAGQAAGVLSGTSREYGLEESVLKSGPVSSEALQASLARQLDTAALIRKAVAKAKSKGEADSATASVRNRYAKASGKLKASEGEIRKRQEQYAALQQKAAKYSTLLEQYRTQVHLDSALNYARLDALRGKDASYKDMAKAAAGLLPDGRVKKAMTGLTHLEGGILDRYESEYTLAGQTLKGVSGGYDIGFATVGVTAGYTEYVNRQGVLDRYLGYLGRVDLKEQRGQKLGFVYYGYTPTRQVLRSDYFSGNVDAAYPTFARPVHILAVTHTGKLGRDLRWQTEAATSLQAGTPQQTVGLDNAAVKTAAEYALPRTGVRLLGEWEHLGKAFENRSLPLARAGTERYTAGAAGEFLRGFLHLGVTLNYLEQHNLSSVGYSTRWGFEARTKSKRYPNIQVSYKPFSTFRAVSDTLAAAQRPLFGEVWAARGSYQLKRAGGVSHRFTVSYTRNSTTSDTASYRSVTAQGGYLYADRRWLLGVNGGWMELPTVVAAGYRSGASWFGSVNAARTFGRVGVNGSQDIAYAPFGLQRLSTTAGASYRMVKAPLTLRATLRYTHYRQEAGSGAGTLVAAQVGFGWHFAVPLSDKTDTR